MPSNKLKVAPGQKWLGTTGIGASADKNIVLDSIQLESVELGYATCVGFGWVRRNELLIIIIVFSLDADYCYAHKLVRFPADYQKHKMESFPEWRRTEM